MIRTVLLAVMLLVLTPLTLACGGGEKDTSAQPEPLSKAEFSARANEICAEERPELEAAAEDLSDQPSDAEIRQFAEDVFIPVMQKQHDAIADLGAPEGDEDEVQAILEAMQDGIDVVKNDPSTLLSSERPLQKANDLADAYGLTDCSI